MRSGFTTGSCSAAASAAALTMLLTQKKIDTVTILTPKGVSYSPVIEEPRFDPHGASCAVRKDGGDDVDITDGILVCAEVRFSDPETVAARNRAALAEAGMEPEPDGTLPDWMSPRVFIDGGEGVGRVTRPGLDMPVGFAAINSTPRRMIIRETGRVCEDLCYDGAYEVKIFVPEGRETAKKTFNSHMGIEGGISILGTSGVVEPMSVQALLDTIRVDLSMQKSEKMPVAVIVPGNYGETFLGKEYNFPKSKIVHCSNYVGEAIDMAIEMGFDRILMAAHTGKFIKVSGGIMNTHSSEADGRAELLLAAAVEAAVRLRSTALTLEKEKELLDCVSTTAGLEILRDLGLLEETSRVAVEKIQKSLLYRTKKTLAKEELGRVQIECILYENSMGELACTEHAKEFLREALEH